MRITINGHPKDIPNAGNIADIVGLFCKNSKHIMTEVNGSIIPNTDWAKTAVQDGDTIELVSFVGGG